MACHKTVMANDPQFQGRPGDWLPGIKVPDFDLVRRYLRLVDEHGFDCPEALAIWNSKLDEPVFLEYCARLRRDQYWKKHRDHIEFKECENDYETALNWRPPPCPCQSGSTATTSVRRPSGRT